ncbi:MAG: hypothetical protein M3Y08_02125, partial [Fibrobacterota bacterium]|nr:hypothetical protein [Fibrobacterota bacterium]
NYMSTQGIQSNQRESELKGARKGLSSVIPGQPPSNGGTQGPGAGQGPVNSIPGLGTAPAGESAPTGEPVKGK